MAPQIWAFNLRIQHNNHNGLFNIQFRIAKFLCRIRSYAVLYSADKMERRKRSRCFRFYFPSVKF